MPNHSITVVEFCAGYAGLGLGLQRALGSAMRSIAYCELEGFAQANLISKMEAGLLDAAPIWSDLRTFPYAKFRGLVDIAAAGIPCQPHSHAGKRLGGADERFLFDEWLDGLGYMQPGYIFIENVEGLLSSKMPDGTLCIKWTVERLEGMGYRVAAGIFSAAEVGAPHQRKRVFILAHRIESGLEGYAGHGAGRFRQVGQVSEPDRPVGEGGLSFWPSRPGEPQHEWEPPRVVANPGRSQRGAVVAGGDEYDGHNSGRGQEAGWPAQSGEAVAHAGSPRTDALTKELRPRDSAAGESSAVADTSILNGSGRESRSGWRERSAVNAATGHEGVIGQTQPPLGGNADGPAGGLDYGQLCIASDNRTDELRLLGNGVVPAVAHKAFITLTRELFNLDQQ